ncbi:MAG: DUF2723 domain-containing protein, partial [Anaerohalosphaera sp.]|nr:DUF2723 domain-containing protein [Anaerohalosphaera sp.]
MFKEKSNIAGSYLVVLVLAVVLYALTCSRGPLWQDSGMIQYRVWHNDITGGLGLALSHPLFYMLAIAAKYIPYIGLAAAVSLVSVLGGAITVANVFLLVRLSVNRLFPAIIAAVSISISWTFWQHAVMSETYTLYTAFFTAELLLLFQYFRTGRKSYLYLLALANGLAIAVHMLASLAMFIYFCLLVVLAVRRKVSFSDIGLMVLLWVAGALPYEYIIVKEMLSSGDIAATISSAMFGNKWSDNALNVSLSARIVFENFAFLGYSFPTVNILLMFVGISTVYKVLADKQAATVLLAIYALFFVFAFRYTVPDRYAFFIPFYCISAIFIGFGAHVFLAKYSKKAVFFSMAAMCLMPVAVYAVTPALLEDAGINLGMRREIPFRNNYTYLLTPWKCNDKSEELFAGSALNDLAEDSVIIADGTVVYALWYAQVIKGIYPDVTICSDHGSYSTNIPDNARLDELTSKGRLYVVSDV